MDRVVSPRGIYPPQGSLEGKSGATPYRLVHSGALTRLGKACERNTFSKNNRRSRPAAVSSLPADRRVEGTRAVEPGSSTLDELQQQQQQQPGLIFGRGSRGAWDTGGAGNPVVRCYIGDDEQRWYMWYNGFSEANRSSEPPHASCIGLATSSDGIHWLRGEGDTDGHQGPSQLHDVGRVLGPNPDWWFHDTRHVSVSDVQIFSSDAVNTGVGVYWMFYTGASLEPSSVPSGFPGLSEGQEVEGLRTRIGLAMSQDGRNWARIEANHHTGALFDAGDDGDWDEALNGGPQVLALGPNEMRMYYHSYDAREQRWVVGVASSQDGFKWKKQGVTFKGGKAADFDGKGAATHCIVRDAETRRYVMFYEAVAADDTRSISVAVSWDGLSNWKRYGKPVLSAGGAGTWDSAAVGCPCAVAMADGKWRLYYSGKQDLCGPWQGIGLAITDAEDAALFEDTRIAFKRRSSKA